MTTKLNVRPYNNKEQLLFPPSIGDFIPEDDLVHVVNDAVELIDLTSYYRKISPVGNPSYDPRLLIKVWFYGYCVKTYSSRKIEDKLYRDVGFIYLAGMQRPDFRTISDFRKNNLNELKKSFVDILRICHRLGMIQLGNISIDSKVMKANASAYRTYTEKELIEEQQELEKAIQEYLEKANETDHAEDQKYGSDKRGNELPENIRNKEQRLKKMKEAVEELKQARKKIKESGKEKINLTDESAQFQKGSGKIIPGYRAEIAVDSKEQVIVANDVTNEQNDVSRLLPMVEEVLENVEEVVPERFSEGSQQKGPINIIADAGYSSATNLNELEKERYERKIEPYIPDATHKKKGQEKGKGYDKDSPFHKSKFVYNEKENSFTCPAGKKLRYVTRYVSAEVTYYVYGNDRDCKSCRHYDRCTNCKSGRRISISEYQGLVDRMREKLSTLEGKKIYGIRKSTVETAFGNLSQNLGYREFLLRGIQKVKGEFSLMCIAHNLLKISRVVRNFGKSLKGILSQGGVIPACDTS